MPNCGPPSMGRQMLGDRLSLFGIRLSRLQPLEQATGEHGIECLADDQRRDRIQALGPGRVSAGLSSSLTKILQLLLPSV